MMVCKKEILLLLALIGIGFPGHNLSIFAQENAFIREITGDVTLKLPNESAWTPAAAGDTLTKNTLISTGFKSSALIALGNSTLTIRPLTRLSLEEIILNQDNETVSLNLQTGRVRADVAPPSGGKTDFTVRSPSVTASVRGTSFEMDTMNLHVDNGRVQYSLANGRKVFVTRRGNSYFDEANNRVVSPFEAAAQSLTPSLPIASDSGASNGDRAPIIGNNASTLDGDFRVGFEWD
ncbi:conserved hypothetical protein [Treponema primitia ZAS-2]|uniref:FecR protein domain-containing protein n=1 Tax=Treponema primitia (strain ATCC BAA-887 / DSM 12427 / ZAS-2) TaxID=545694 RepID=F5YI09_TREPZ|nr:FecR family protein [Treponema primitia]AEF85403.1 conserved hypothetical protein [Treponema primitia ZAS-2]